MMKIERGCFSDVRNILAILGTGALTSDISPFHVNLR